MIGLDRYKEIAAFTVAANSTYIKYHHLGSIPKLVVIVFSINPDMSGACIIPFYTIPAGTVRGGLCRQMYKDRLTIVTGDTPGLDPNGSWVTAGYYKVHVWA